MGLLGFTSCARDDLPNLILVSLDGVRADHLGCYGYPRDTSPFLDRLAAQGVVFENAVATTSWTIPSHTAILTSLPNAVHGVNAWGQTLDPARETIAEVLHDRGYHTAAFVSGPPLHPHTGLDQGFDRYVDCSTYLSREDPELQAELDVALETIPRDDPKARTRARLAFLADLRRTRPSRVPRDITSPRVLAAFRRWLDEEAEEPFFVFLHFFDPHVDYAPPPPYDRRFGEGRGADHVQLFLRDPTAEDLSPADWERVVALYDGEIRFVDDHLALVHEALGEQGWADPTGWIVTADHGEEFLDHGQLFHMQTLFEEVLHVPLLLRPPGGLATSRRDGRLVGTLDIAPTLAALAGTSMHEGWGIPLAPPGAASPDAFLDRALPADLLLPGGQELRAIRFRDFAVLSDGEGRWYTGFDLEADPAEAHPLGPRVDPRTKAGAERLEREWAAMRARRKAMHWEGTAATELPEEVRQRLEQLGYTGDRAPR